MLILVAERLGVEIRIASDILLPLLTLICVRGETNSLASLQQLDQILGTILPNVINLIVQIFQTLHFRISNPARVDGIKKTDHLIFIFELFLQLQLVEHFFSALTSNRFFKKRFKRKSRSFDFKRQHADDNRVIYNDRAHDSAITSL